MRLGSCAKHPFLPAWRLFERLEVFPLDHSGLYIPLEWRPRRKEINVARGVQHLHDFNALRYRS
ncbi:MAG: hypothetical protein ACREOH_22055 [Candidatus Entotheonellia bacterium]